MSQLNQAHTRILTPAKTALFSIVYGFHKRLALKALPDRLGIYFHALERDQWPAFRDCVEAIRSNGYEIVSIDDYIRPENARRRQAFISLDDNYKSWYDALPLFEELDVKLTFYVNTLPFRDIASEEEISSYFDRIVHYGERISLTRQEVKDIHTHGHTIGAHTHTHYRLNKLPREKWDDEILQSKLILEELIAEPVRHFSYPFGMRRFFTPELATYCEEIGFETIAAAIPGMLHEQPLDRMRIHRTAWRTEMSSDGMIENLRIDGRWFEKLTGRSAIG